MPLQASLSSQADHFNPNGSSRMDEASERWRVGVGVSCKYIRLQGRDRAWARLGRAGSFV